MNSVKKSFGGAEVLNGIDLEVKAGEKIALTGGNGVGKSTLLNIATGFLRADSGNLSLNGLQLNSPKAWQFSRLGIKRSFQNARMSPSLLIKDQFFVNANILKNFDAMLSQSGLVPYFNCFPYETPLPILKRLEIIRALITEPKIIFLDEPSAGLSAREQKNLAKFFLTFVSDNIAVVIIEHQLELIKQVATKIVTLESGILN